MLTMNKLAQAIALATVVLTAPAVAQDFVQAPAEAASVEIVAIETMAEQTIPGDSGVQAIENASSQPYKQEAPVEETFTSAEEQLNAYMESKGWSAVWDPEKKRMFVVAAESFNVQDPSYDSSFVAKRSLYASLASMQAKTKVIEFMRTQMSAQDQLIAPGTDVYESLNKQYSDAIKKVEAQQRAITKLLAEFNAAEADHMAGVTWKDLSREAMAAMIKQLDASFNTATIEQKKQERYQLAKSRYEEAMAELDKIKVEAEAINGDVTMETSSSVETLARAPLMGATVLAQAESWDAENEEYQIAVLLVWSEALEEGASSILQGAPMRVKTAQQQSVGQWLNGQDLSTMTGPRQFIDKDGVRWYIGAYSTLYDGSASAKRAARGRADLFAMKELAVSLYADLETHKQAEIASQTRNAGLGGKDVTNVAESFAQTTRQAIENRQIQGASKLAGKEILHPVSGQKMYVSVYAISSESAVAAVAAESRNYANAIQAAQGNTESAGFKQGLNQQMQEAKNDQAAYLQGQKEAHTAVAEAAAAKAEKTAATQQATRKVYSSQPKGQTPQGATQSQSVFAAPALSDDDF